jgi:hypothetical protein
MKYLMTLLLTLQLHALSDNQSKNLRTAFKLGKQIHASNGFTFEKTLCAIMLQESSAGIQIIGDKYKNGRLKNLYHSSLGVFQIKLSTARYVIKKSKYLRKHFVHLLKDDKMLVNLLLTSTEFSTIVAANYLIMNYEIALKRGYENPYHSAISRYNGGWINSTYKSNIFERMEYIKKLRIF